MEGIEKFQMLEANLKPILEQKSSGLLPYQVTELSNRLLESTAKLSELSSEHPALADAVREVMRQVNDKRKELSANANTNDLSEEDINTLTNLVDVAATQVNEWKTRAEQAEAALAEQETDEDEGENEDNAEDEGTDNSTEELTLENAIARIASLEEDLAAAVALISHLNNLNETLTQEEDDSDEIDENEEGETDSENEDGTEELAEEIADAIEAVIEAEPRLGEAVEILADCESADEVLETAKALLKELNESVHKTTKTPVTESVRNEVTALRKRSLFENASDFDFESEREINEGEHDPEADEQLHEHKGRKLAALAVKSLHD